MKKLKLSLSICMMCLCVAVLCMGILAASSATYNINGNISYNMIDGVALVNTRVYKVADQKTTTQLETTATTLSTMTFETIEQTSGYVLSQKLDTKATLSNGATSGEISAGSINIGFGATDSSVWYYTFYIVINITNLSSSGTLSATLTDNTTYASTITKVVNTSQMTTIEKGDTKNIVIGLTIPSTTTDEIDTTISYSLIVNYKNYQCTLDGTTIYFTKDMTWTEYVAILSDSSNFDTSGEYLFYNSKKIEINSTKVAPTDAIVDGGTYSLVTVEYGTFVFEGNSFTFEIGMTWADFIDSEYNSGTDSFYIIEDADYILYGSNSLLVYSSATASYYEIKTNVILNGNKYIRGGGPN